jgi:streptogramin lyase
MRTSRLATLVIIFILAVAAGTYAIYRLGATTTSGPCTSNYAGPAPTRSQLTDVSLGHLTEYQLPGNSRAPNAITVASDGSVWFGEESLPALAHLFQNGTLLEYVWPGTYPPPGATGYSCGYRTQIWGVALWNGSVWATDTSGNQIVSLDPSTGTFHYYTLTSNAFPDYMVAGLDGRLWFTELFTSSIVRVDQNGTVQTYQLPTGISGTPTQILFVNSSYALYADAGQAGELNGGVYGFNPDHPAFTRVGGVRQLTGITGLATTPGGIWISEHGPPFVNFYNLSSSSWTDYPTSIVPYSYTTLPYFIKSDGAHIWFNEHYGDRIAEIDTASRSLVEYAISNPPAGNLSSISGAQTIARDGEKIWFTELGGNRVGFADFSSAPPFKLASLSGPEVTLKPGSSVVLPFELQGSSSSPVRLGFSDSETSSAVPRNLTATPSTAQFSGFSSGTRFTLNLTAGAKLAPGAYIFDVTATDGFTSYTVFLQVKVP